MNTPCATRVFLPVTRTIAIALTFSSSLFAQTPPGKSRQAQPRAASPAKPGGTSPTTPSPSPAGSPGIVTAAREQIGKTTSYSPEYVRLAFPGGDLPIHTGVCTDVVIRALRADRNLDLQLEVNSDMKQAFSAYPKLWGLSRPDPNIDHRRVPNLICWFKRKGYSLPVTDNKANFLPGDLVTCIVPPNLPHIMVVSGKRSESGAPLVIHNIGAGTREEDCLFTYKMTGHFRLPPTPQAPQSGK